MEAELLEDLRDEMLREIVREALRQFGEARQAPPIETDAALLPRPLWGLAYTLEKTPNDL